MQNEEHQQLSLTGTYFVLEIDYLENNTERNHILAKNFVNKSEYRGFETGFDEKLLKKTKQINVLKNCRYVKRRVESL